MVTLQTADKALKDFYLDAITKEIDGKASAFLSKIEKTTANVVGKNVCKVIKTGINSGIGAGAETGALPTGDSGEYITFNLPLKNLYGTIEISDKAIRASANNEGAFVNLLNEEMDGLVKSAKYNFGRMLFGDGCGYLASVIAVEGNTVKINTTQWLLSGMYVDVWKAGVRTYSRLKIAWIDRETKCIGLEGEDLTANGVPGIGCEFRSCGTELGYELTGLSALFSDEDLYGVDRTSEYMKPYIADSIGEIDEDILQTAIDKIEEQSGGKINMILCSWAVRRALIRYFKENPTLLSMMDVGENEKVLAYNGIPIIADRFCPESTLYLLNTDDFKICQLCDWQWMEGEDGKILKQVAGKPVYTATLVKYADLICERPCGQGVLMNITV